ncbi:MAG: alpha-amylase, partial [Treponema sp.]|nr:alpha-amylase [Treponema sp.]
MKSKINSSIFYHIYPIGMCGVPKKNDFCSPSGNAINRLSGELEKIKNLGANAIYIGPLFESSSHGYDTVDYYFVDRRLGNNED